MKQDSSNYDAIIVGAGGSGLAAAYAVAERGGRVLVLEKLPQPGGTTGIAVGTFTASATSVQRAAGIADDAQAHAEDAAKFARPEDEARNNETLRRFFLQEAGATFEWIRGLGLSFHGPNPEPPNRVPRMHNVVPGAKAYIAALQAEILRRGGAILCDSSVTGLIWDSGRVVGVRAKDKGGEQEYRAHRGVVLAAGDYASSPDLLARFKGDQFRTIEGINPHATGSGHLLAEEAGATLVNMDITYGPELRFVAPAKKPFQQVLPANRFLARWMAGIYRRLPKSWQTALIKRLLVTWQHPENALFDDGAILLNKHGERFTNERQSPEREIAVAAQPDKVSYILLDGRQMQRYSAWPHFISTAPQIAYAYVNDYLRLRPDVTVRAETLPELAAQRGLDPQRLQATVTAFNRYTAGQQPDVFGRNGDLHPLENCPWLLIGPAKAYITTTEGGALINEKLQVLDKNGQPIPGLYAVGQVGLGGMVLWGHGLHIAWAMTSGRLAGRAIMEGV